MAKLRGKEEYPFYFGAKPEILKIAGELRRTSTQAERLMWQILKGRKISGYKFRRQHPVGEFVVDFFCYESMLAIEVDGSVHEESYQKQRDLERTKILNSLGIQVLRFSNTEIETNIEKVIKTIKENLKNDQ